MDRSAANERPRAGNTPRALVVWIYGKASLGTAQSFASRSSQQLWPRHVQLQYVISTGLIELEIQSFASKKLKMDPLIVHILYITAFHLTLRRRKSYLFNTVNKNNVCTLLLLLLQSLIVGQQVGLHLTDSLVRLRSCVKVAQLHYLKLPARSVR